MTLPSAPLSSPDPIPGPAAITTELLQEWIARRQRFRGRVKAVVAITLSLVVGVLAVGWTFFHKQLTAKGNLQSLGYAVEWDINLGNLATGGTSAVIFRPRWSSSNALFDPNVLNLLRSLSHLVTLDLSSVTEMTEDDLAVLADFAELTDLQINRSPTWRGQVIRPFDDRVLDHVKGLTKLKALGLGDNRITDVGLAKIANLTGLESLDLDGTLVTDHGLDSLRGMTKLKHLRLENTAVTREGIAELQRALPNTEISFEKLSAESVPK
jgi:Leucine-rich repeat (LRR) protein